MEYLGRVEEITNDGRIIVRCETLPDIGDSVFDAKSNRIGAIGRILGPVDGPYASVIPDRNTDSPKMKGKDIFYRKRQQNGKDKRRNR